MSSLNNRVIDFNALKNAQEQVSLALFIVCPRCNARVMAIGQALLETSCPKCNRVYSPKTRGIMRECYERNTAHKG